MFCVLFSKLPLLFLPSLSATRHMQLYVRELYTHAFGTRDRCIIVPHPTRALPALRKLGASQPLWPDHSISASYALLESGQKLSRKILKHLGQYRILGMSDVRQLVNINLHYTPVPCPASSASSSHPSIYCLLPDLAVHFYFQPKREMLSE